MLDLLRHKPPPLLAPDGRLASDLWLDQPGAPGEIDRRRAAGRFSADDAERLHHFVDRGYLTFSIDVDQAASDAIFDAVDRAWKERPSTLAYSYQSQLRPFSESDEAAERKPSYRIADLHSWCPEAMDLYLHPRVFEMIELVFDYKAIASQSLTFEYGSHQRLHRDPVYVHHTPPSHLVAAWIALEDIDAASGPLTYVPGSHLLPYHQLDPGDFRFYPERHGTEDSAAMAAGEEAAFRARGLAPEPFLAKRGEVLVWHHSLLHGGSEADDPALTRKSFVVHFATFGSFEKLTQILEPAAPGEPFRSRTTRRLLERDGCYGFDNPLRGG